MSPSPDRPRPFSTPPPGTPPDALPSPIGPRRSVVAIILGIALLGGAAGGVLLLRSTDADPETASGGWAIRDLALEGFSLALPPGWQDVSPGTVDESLDALREDDPALAEAIEGQITGSLSALVRFFAFDTASPTLTEGFATNVNVVVEPLPAGVDFARYLEANLTQLRKLPNVTATLTDDDLELPGGRAAVVSSTFTLPGPAGPQEVAVRQYLFLRGSRGFILSMTTTPAAEEDYIAVWDRIARTFRPH